MISIEQIASYLENGLNEVYGNPNIKFHIWADVGKLDKPTRDGNTVTHFITGNLRVTSSSNDANMLEMGANGLSLEFSIPQKRPRSTVQQTPQELQEIQGGQYTFVQEILNVINTYFKNAQSFTLMDGEEEYSLSFQAGTSTSGVADISSELGKNVTASVYLTLYFIKGGIISNNVNFTIDGMPVPFQSLQFGRSTENGRDVYAGKDISKQIASSSAFSVDLTFPLNVDNITQESLAFLLDGVPNTAHFMGVQYGKDAEKRLYLVSIDNIRTVAQGVTVSGATVALAEVVEHAEALNYPAGYQVGRFSFNDSTAQTITFTLSGECSYYLGGTTGEGNGQVTVQLSPDDFVYDDTTDKYFVYLVTSTPVSVSSTIPFEVT